MKIRLFLTAILALFLYSGCYTVIWTPDQEMPKQERSVVINDPYNDYYDPPPWWDPDPYPIIHPVPPRDLITIPPAASNGGGTTTTERPQIERPGGGYNSGDKGSIITTGSAGISSGKTGRTSEKAPEPKRPVKDTKSSEKVDNDSKSGSSSGSGSSSSNNSNSSRTERTRENNSNNSGSQIRNSGERRR